MATSSEYNPLDYGNLTKNVVQELMSRGPYPLPPVQVFGGAGVYALFYDGGFEPYATLRSPAADYPVYVGKAVPAGARIGTARTTTQPARPLHARLAEHAQSIAWATNLDVTEFVCRYLVVTPLWITMAERFLIEHYQPVWNVCIAGFGLHDPGSGRHQGEIPWWDALHPGRPWAARLRQTRDYAMAEQRLAGCLKGTQIPIHLPAPLPLDVEPDEDGEGLGR